MAETCPERAAEPALSQSSEWSEEVANGRRRGISNNLKMRRQAVNHG